MAKKTRKQKQRAAARAQLSPVPGAAGLPVDANSDVGTADPVDPPAAEAPPSAGAVRDDAVAAPVVPTAAGELPSSPAGGRRRIERLQSAGGRLPERTARVPSNAASMFAPLESDDAAIPFDRVPYVRADLRRVAIMAAVMVVLIIVAALVVPHVVK